MSACAGMRLGNLHSARKVSRGHGYTSGYLGLGGFEALWQPQNHLAIGYGQIVLGLLDLEYLCVYAEGGEGLEECK